MKLASGSIFYVKKSLHGNPFNLNNADIVNFNLGKIFLATLLHNNIRGKPRYELFH